MNTIIKRLSAFALAASLLLPVSYSPVLAQSETANEEKSEDLETLKVQIEQIKKDLAKAEEDLAKAHKVSENADQALSDAQSKAQIAWESVDNAVVQDDRLAFDKAANEAGKIIEEANKAYSDYETLEQSAADAKAEVEKAQALLEELEKKEDSTADEIEKAKKDLEEKEANVETAYAAAEASKIIYEEKQQAAVEAQAEVAELEAAIKEKADALAAFLASNEKDFESLIREYPEAAKEITEYEAALAKVAEAKADTITAEANVSKCQVVYAEYLQHLNVLQMQYDKEAEKTKKDTKKTSPNTSTTVPIMIWSGIAAAALASAAILIKRRK